MIRLTICLLLLFGVPLGAGAEELSFDQALGKLRVGQIRRVHVSRADLVRDLGLERPQRDVVPDARCMTRERSTPRARSDELRNSEVGELGAGRRCSAK